MNVSQIMTTEVSTCTVDDALSQCADNMRHLNVGAMPVVDSDKHVRGIITDRDIAVRAVASGVDPNQVTVGQFMTADPVTALPEVTVEDAAGIMAEQQVRRLPVVDHNGCLLGIVSLGDLAVDVGEAEMLAEALERISMPVR